MSGVATRTTASRGEDIAVGLFFLIVGATLLRFHRPLRSWYGNWPRPPPAGVILISVYFVPVCFVAVGAAAVSLALCADRC